MLRFRSSRSTSDLPDEVVISVQSVSRAASLPDPEAPPWLKRLLPKSGMAGQLSRVRDDNLEEEDEDEDDEEGDFDEERSALHEVSFEVRRGEGTGIAGNDRDATLAFMRILTRGLPPTSGRVVHRGRIAALCKADIVKYFNTEAGMDAVGLVAHFLHWPRSLLRARREEILKFARLEELEGLAPRPHRNKSTMRLLFAAALHMDATVYVVDEGIPSDDAYGERCFDLLAQRQKEGAAVIQRAAIRVENVARLCNHVLWFEDGKVKFQGRPLDVAIEAEKAYKEELHPLSAPILASLSDSLELVQVTGEGGRVDIDLEVLRKHLDLGLALQLTDHQGHSTRLEQPQRFQSEAAGLYRLRVSIPGGLLPEASYEAKLLAEVGALGSEPMPPRELLAFEIVSSSDGEVDGDEANPMFEQPADWDEQPGTENQVEWDVSRASA